MARLNEISFKKQEGKSDGDDSPIPQFPLLSSIRVAIPNASAPTQSVTNRNAAMKQKCKEELLLWESEPMPDLTQESETDQCEFLAQQHPGKFPTGVESKREALVRNAKTVLELRNPPGKQHSCQADDNKFMFEKQWWDSLCW